MVWKWLGHGFLAGIPMRDIPDSEAKERGIEAILKQCPDYEHVKDAPEPSHAATAKKESGGEGG